MLSGRVVMPGKEAIFKRLLNKSLDKNVQFCKKDRMQSASWQMVKHSFNWEHRNNELQGHCVFNLVIHRFQTTKQYVIPQTFV